MSPCLCLQVILWVPVRVKDDDRVSSGQVDPETPGTGREEETEVLGPLSIEVIYGVFTQLTTNRTIQSLESVKLHNNTIH